MKSWLVLSVLLAAAAIPVQASASAGPQRANIVLTKTADATTVESGGIAGYRLTVSNTGRGTGVRIVLRDSLPTLPGVSWVMTSGVGGCQIRTRQLGCQIPQLHGGQSLSIHLITPTTQDSCGVLSNTATVTTAEGVSTTVGPVLISLHCKAFPKLTTSASPPSGVPGQGNAVFDTATLSGCANNTCSGSVTFALFGPNSCVTLALGPGTFPVVNNTAKGNGVSGVLPAGDYYWLTTYSGDANNNPVSLPGCGDPNERFQIPPLNSPALFSIASPHSAIVGQGFVPKDTAFLTGCFAFVCTGTITLAVVGPNNCNTIALGPATFQVQGNSVSTPGIWTPALPGNYYWTASYSGDFQNNPVSPAVGCGDGNELIRVGAADQLSTAASPQIVASGQPVSLQDTASLSGCYNNACTGTVTFKLLGPNSCAVTALGPITVGLNSNSATAQANWTPVSLGNYYWVASYGGDVNNLPAAEGCGDFAELVHVSPANKPTPTLATVASPNTGTVGQGMAVFDTATLSGCFNNVCTGSITFALVGPNSCSTIALGPATFAIANNSYKAVGVWIPKAGGDYYWTATYSGDADNNPVGPVGCLDSNELIHVPTPPPPPNNPNLIALALPAFATVGHGAALQDVATLTGCADDVCAGTVTFTLVGPDSCETTALGPITVGVDADSATVNADWTPSAPGDYYWTATYSGDVANNPINPAVGCSDPSQLVRVTFEPPSVGVTAAPNPADVGQTVTLIPLPSGGNGSYTYSWQINSMPNGSTAALSNPIAPSPTFVPDRSGTYVVEVIVQSNGVNSAAASVAVVVHDSPVPVAVSTAATPNSADIGQKVALTASPSGGNGSYTYAWTLTSPVGSAAELSDPTAPSPTFTPDLAGSYTVALTVTDGNGVASPAVFLTVVVHEGPVPVAVSIVAAPNPAVVGQTVTLSASPSGGNGSYTYAWTLSPPPGSMSALSDPADPSPTFKADLAGSYTVALTVTDGNGVASPAVFLTVNVGFVP